LRLEELEARWVPAVLTPAQVRHAYAVDQANYLVNGRPVTGDGSGQTIAIVDAYNDPYVSRDLQTFDRQYGLPDPSFRQYYYGSASNYNNGWAQETTLDVEWAHAIAPRANILLITAASSSYNDLMTAVNWVRQQAGVSVVSMSWGGGEWSGETSLDSYFKTPAGHNGITFVASSGDNGARVSYPSASPNVVSVGGTVLSVDGQGNYLGETGWSGSGGGYSGTEREPNYQYSVQSTGRRSNPDVAYNAGTGVSVVCTLPSTGRQAWYSIGGTSAGAPQWAALIAIADQIRVAAGAHTLDGPSQTLYALYSSTMNGDFHDITTGSNGYAAHSGYDLVTGRGTPIAWRVILDLARVNDSFHGAMANTAGASPALAGQAALFAEDGGGESAPATSAASDVAAALGSGSPQTATRVGGTAVSETGDVSLDVTLALLTEQQHPARTAATTEVGHARAHAPKTAGDALSRDAVFADADWAQMQGW
jgi:subtilase family serine protease